MGNKSVVAKYEKMTPRELNAEAAKFDKEMVTTKSRPMTAKELARWKKVSGRPVASKDTAK